MEGPAGWAGQQRSHSHGGMCWQGLCVRCDLRAAALGLVILSQDDEIARQIFKNLNGFLNISIITTK